MHDLLRPAFWALCLGLTLPIAAFVALEAITPERAPRQASRPRTSQSPRSLQSAQNSQATRATPVSQRSVRLGPIEPAPRTVSEVHPDAWRGHLADSVSDESALWGEQNQLALELSELREHVRSVSDSQQKQQLEQLQQSTQLLQQLHQASKLQDLEQQVRDLASGRPQANSAGLRSIDADEANTGSRSPSVVIELDPDVPGQLYLELHQAQLPAALHELARVAGQNLVVARDVAGTVSLILDQVTYETALETLLKAGGLETEQEGGLTVVRPKALVKPVAHEQPVAPPTMSKLFRPAHVPAGDVRRLIEPILTPGVGKISDVRPASHEGPAPDRPEAIVVQDRPEVIAAVERIMIEADTPPLQVVIEARVLGVRLTDEMKYGINFGLLGATTGPSALPEDDLHADDCPPGAEEAGLRYATVHAHIPQVINALARIADFSVIASPQIVAINGQQAELEIGEEAGYRTVASPSGVAVEGLQFVETGTRIRLRPRVAPDGVIRMEIEPRRRSSVGTKGSQPPRIATAGMETQVLVRDGETVLIGGIIEEQVREDSTRVPVLGNLPLVGGAFRKSSERVERSELLVLLTARIVTEGQSGANLLGRVPQAERRHQLMREQQSLSNRRQAARRHYERGLAAYRKGDLSKARHEARDALELDKTNAKIVAFHDSLERAIRWQARPVVPAAHVIPDDRPATLPSGLVPSPRYSSPPTHSTWGTDGASSLSPPRGLAPDLSPRLSTDELPPVQSSPSSAPARLAPAAPPLGPILPVPAPRDGSVPLPTPTAQGAIQRGRLLR
jgi:type II secretory pathway component GspD/PulD (secretin)